MVHKNIFKNGFILCCVAAALFLLSLSTRNGVGVGGDATIYITSARNLLDGKGLGLINPDGDFRLIPYFPPFYSLVIAALGKIGMDLSFAAGFINALSFAGMVWVITRWMVTRNRSPFPALLFAVLLSGSPILIPAFSWGMSEPLAFLLGFTALVLIEEYITDGGLWKFLLAALFTGLSFITRYASAAFLAAAVCSLFLFQKQGFKKRLTDSIFLGVIAALPMLVWLWVDYSATQTVSSRSMTNGSLAEQLSLFFGKLHNVFAVWFVPESWIDSGRVPAEILPCLSALVLLFPLFCLVLAVFSLKRGRLNPTKTRTCRMLMIQSVLFYAYLLTIAAVSARTFPPITINSRMLLPAYVSFFWMVFLLLELFLNDNRNNWLRVPLIILFGLFSAYCMLRGARIARQNAIDGMGYNNREWRESELIAYINEQVPPEQIIVTNEETALLYLAERISWPMREIYVNEPDGEWYAYKDTSVTGTDKARDLFLSGDALLVVFNTFTDQMAEVYGEDAPARVNALLEGLIPKKECADGVVYSVQSR